MFGYNNNFNPYAANPYAVPYQQQQAQQMPPQVSQPMQAAQAPQLMPSNNSGIIWVQGEAGAKGYLMTPSTSLLLMDSEGDYFYIKTTDNTGMPTLRKYAYNEVTSTPTKTVENVPKNDFSFDPNKYITREEFEAEMAKFASKTEPAKKVKKEVEENGK